MQISKKEGALVPSSTTEIEPVYSKAIAQTENHYRVMVEFVKAQMIFLSQKSEVKSQKFFTQDLEQMGGVAR